jgi:hypothetical protein
MQDLIIIHCQVKEDRYIFIFDDDHAGEALRTFNRFATNPDLNFDWYHAARCSQELRDILDTKVKK